jgi:hypothetical protein
VSVPTEATSAGDPVTGPCRAVPAGSRVSRTSQTALPRSEPRTTTRPSCSSNPGGGSGATASALDRASPVALPDSETPSAPLATDLEPGNCCHSTRARAYKQDAGRELPSRRRAVEPRPSCIRSWRE